MAYIRNAPPALIKLYEKRFKHADKLTDMFPGIVVSKFVIAGATRPLLKKLLSDSRMKRAWNIIEKSLEKPDEYPKFFYAIIESMRIARNGIFSPVDRRDRYETIAKLASRLVKLIQEPDSTKPSIDHSGYRGELDLMASALLPNDVASILGAPSWATMAIDQRTDLARPLLRQWPTMVELLTELAGMARQCGQERISPGRRSRGDGEGTTDKEKVTKTKARLFSCHLDDYLCKIDKRFSGFAAIHTIVLVAYSVNFERKSLRKVIMDHRKKRRLMGVGKIVIE